MFIVITFSHMKCSRKFVYIIAERVQLFDTSSNEDISLTFLNTVITIRKPTFMLFQ
ncbi:MULTISPECIES: hypothetical protein [Bacillus]|uniref:hypothetical protein n=1 Tax=Bacillus TaxID=1386 RepID=UPI000314D12E|nr:MULTISPECIES: hypothetical protein [Bacillus]KLA27366.1 hypothetical protein B4080_1033 [Bacillus cereus]MCU4824065.1 hypothetical protein [Bacillus cereus]MCU4856886.1 hypothetical protein [Bacillus cereus]MCU4873064.1 hypothetical protein [Bacillus cereus]MCU4927893.1 hypothetical protein [Bacillus cereus]